MANENAVTADRPAAVATVTERGCTQVQGYLFSRPLTPADARAFLQRNIDKFEPAAPGAPKTPGDAR